MPEERVDASGGQGNAWRLARWIAIPLILLLPLVAMQFTDEVNWTLSDFAVFGALLVAAGACYELAVKKAGNATYRTAAGIALAAAFMLVWVNGAVGIIGSEDNEANQMYFLVLAIGFLGAIIARGRSHGMARALFATALAQAAVAMVAIVAGSGEPISGPLEIAALNGFFIALFVASALLFRKAGREPTSSDAAQGL